MWVYIISAGIFILCIFLDLLFNIVSPKKDKEFFPNLRIWAIGILLGTAVLIFSKILPTLDKLDKALDIDQFPYPTSQVITYISTLVFLIVLIGIFIWAVIKISKEDS
ncbi:MAG: hypothetical protein PVH61_10525 [Candidatus Aminicenantes bacterium]|jgi:hypothetical protein